jgi:sulfur-oxidizing protein SoxX
MKRTHILALSTAAVLAAACAGMQQGDDSQYSAKALALMKTSFKERGQAKLDRLDQDDMQKLCSQYEGKPLPKDVADKLEKAQQALIKYPADGNYLGDFRSGERIAQSGQGKQFNDDPSRPAGANCYACHQLSKAEL